MDDFVSGFSSLNMLRIREFLNDTVYTDSMLNHIIVNAGSVQQWRVFI